ncbi:MAG: hypothetical protein RR396_05005 [Clostridiales bacterium]
MRSYQEINRKVDIYKNQLSNAIEEKAIYDNRLSPDIDLVIFSLVDKLEALFWVLDLDLPEGDVLDKLHQVNH